MEGLTPEDRQGRKQKIVDRLLTLYLYDKVSESSQMYGDTKLQKLVFLSEQDMIQQRINGFHYRFFRYDLGPFSTELRTDHEVLQANDLVDLRNGQTTEIGQQVLNEADELLTRNEGILDSINNIIAEYGRYSGSQLMDIVYDMEVDPLTTGESIRVEDMPKHMDIYFQLPEDIREASFEIDDGWIETLDILFHKDSREGLNEAMEAAREQPSIPFER